MQSHVIRVTRALWAHRYPIALGVALACTVAMLVVATPWLLVIALIEHRYGGAKRRRRLIGLACIAVLAYAARWLWREMHGIPHRAWHACAQCGRPIEAPSRAAYCSHACRTYARLERDALDNDPRIAERAERRIRNMRLREVAHATPEWEEVPF